MTHLPLELREGHLFIEVHGDRWLFDTGAPSSFGTPGQVTIAGEQCSLATSYLGLDAAKLSGLVGVPCVGLLGADVLGRFDHIVDIEGGRLTLSTDELAHDGQAVGLEDFLGVPIVTARIGGREHRLFFDTGAQVSYLEDESIRTFPDAGRLGDFYPGFGPFETDTFNVPLSLGPVGFTLRCGTLPDILGMTLMVAGVRGIVGNAILRGRTVGYSEAGGDVLVNPAFDAGRSPLRRQNPMKATRSVARPASASRCRRHPSESAAVRGFARKASRHPRLRLAGPCGRVWDD